MPNKNSKSLDFSEKRWPDDPYSYRLLCWINLVHKILERTIVNKRKCNVDTRRYILICDMNVIAETFKKHLYYSILGAESLYDYMMVEEMIDRSFILYLPLWNAIHLMEWRWLIFAIR